MINYLKWKNLRGEIILCILLHLMHILLNNKQSDGSPCKELLKIILIGLHYNPNFSDSLYSQIVSRVKLNICTALAKSNRQHYKTLES